MDVSKLVAGTASGTVTISSANAPSFAVPVTITVANAAPAVLSVSSSTERLSLPQGASPASGQVTVSNSGGGTLRFTAQAVSDRGWLTLNGALETGTASGTATHRRAFAALGFTANPAGLYPGLYSANITVGDSNSSRNATSRCSPDCHGDRSIDSGFTQSGLLFSALAGGGQAQPQSFTVANPGTVALNWTAQTSTLSGGGWLNVSPGSGTALPGSSSAVTVSANPAGLAAGQYYGSVTIAAAGATNNPQLDRGGSERCRARRPSAGETIFQQWGGFLRARTAARCLPATYGERCV